MKTAAAVPSATPLEHLKGRSGATLEQEQARLKKATQEFEAFFRYQMMKAMRKTVPENPLTEGLPMNSSQGKETFLELMDMEISKAGSGGPGSISDILYRSTARLLEAKYNDKNGADSASAPAKLHPVTVKRVPIQIKPEPIKLPENETPAIPLESKPDIAPLRPRIISPHESIMRKYGDLIDAAAAETRLDSALIASVIHAESSGNPNAESTAGAKGLMQLADSTAGDYGVTDAFDPEQNIKGGSRFLKALMERYQDVKLALAAYNAGPRNVDKYGGLPPFKETHNYVNKVIELFEQASKGSKVP
jgi:Rod binding domain-containing protein